MTQLSLSGLLPLASEIAAYRRWLAEFQPADGRASRTSGSGRFGLSRAARPFILSSLQRDLTVPLLIITGRADRASAAFEQLAAWSPEPAALLRFPEPSPLPYERTPWGDQTRRQRLETLAALTRPGTRPVVVASGRALLLKTLPRRDFIAGTRTLRRGQTVQLDELLETWVGLGYQPAAVVEAPGIFSRRGGIVDLWPPTSVLPIRIELFGDEIDTLRTFDPATQRSQHAIDQVLITSAREALPRFGPRLAASLQAKRQVLEAESQQADLEELQPPRAVATGQPVYPGWMADVPLLAAGTVFPVLDFYLPMLHSQPGSLLEYFPESGVIVLDDPEEIASVAQEMETQAADLRAERQATGELPPDYPAPFYSWDDMEVRLSNRRVVRFGPSEAQSEDDYAGLGDAFLPGPRFGGQIRLLLDHLRRLRAESQRVVVVSRQAERLAEIWGQEEAPQVPLTSVEYLPPRPSLTFIRGALAEGFTLRNLAGRPSPIDLLHLLTDAEIFGWFRPEPRRRRAARAVAPETYYSDLEPGDYVVHIEHGVGRFEGLTKRTVDGLEREYLLLSYAGGDQLLVPIHQADRVSRYIGADGHTPALHRLGTAEWHQARQRAQQGAEEVAEELLELYAAREAITRRPYSKDSAWQHELEVSFPYLETEDQYRAIAEVKRDMESPRPMDRLICGDVGYGKTEVALRAAFKAVQDGKQVVVLVPTTVLAQQHYNTFTQRLKAFPVNVEMLSRFRSRAEQAEILQRLAQGAIDILIGTHRLLQKDVVFKNLGLLIIDEEQRFGVAAKEQLKRMRTEVDVLTLTATPIPRTLYMSLAGVRDISTIETAPQERLPIMTYVGERNDAVIRQAILREIDRGGQVFYVFNRVQGIEQVYRRLSARVPEARIQIAHGQMDEDALEKAMLDYTNGQVDVLLCTSIIESGLDIPNANTIIVEHSDWFGLAQLYQLRGRVGRGAVRAYAYFLYERSSWITPEARQRLDIIAEAKELGAGYSIAMRDMEMRGAGELLGTQQSGHIAAVGFDLYTRLLARAVQKLRADQRGEPPPPPPPGLVTIDLPLKVYIPAGYIPDADLRLQLVRRMANLESLQAIDDIATELADRFGPIPDPVDNLLYQLRLKLLASAAGVEAIAVEDGQITLRSKDFERMDRYALQRWLGGSVRVGRKQLWMGRDRPEAEWRVHLVEVLERLQQVPRPRPEKEPEGQPASSPAPPIDSHSET